jgi:hypothetical protein
MTQNPSMFSILLCKWFGHRTGRMLSNPHWLRQPEGTYRQVIRYRCPRCRDVVDHEWVESRFF